MLHNPFLCFISFDGSFNHLLNMYNKAEQIGEVIQKLQHFTLRETCNNSSNVSWIQILVCGCSANLYYFSE